MKTKTIRQTVTFKASPEMVYEALMDSKKHSRFTGSQARISRKVGGNFSAYAGYCFGVHLELQEGKKIVQTWRSEEWPEGCFSVATFALAKVPSGAKLQFIQTGVPANHHVAISKGWKEHYWQPMKAMLETGSKAEVKKKPKRKP